MIFSIKCRTPLSWLVYFHSNTFGNNICSIHNWFRWSICVLSHDTVTVLQGTSKNLYQLCMHFTGVHCWLHYQSQEFSKKVALNLVLCTIKREKEEALKALVEGTLNIYVHIRIVEICADISCADGRNKYAHCAQYDPLLPLLWNCA